MLKLLEAHAESCPGGPQCCLRIDMERARENGCGKEQIAKLPLQLRSTCLSVRLWIALDTLYLGDLFVKLAPCVCRRWPDKPNFGRFPCELLSCRERGQAWRDAVK